MLTAATLSALSALAAAVLIGSAPASDGKTKS